MFGLVFSKHANAGGAATHIVQNSKVYNNTFYKGESSGTLFYSSSNGGLTFIGNEFKNNIVHTSPRLYTSYINDASFLKEYNNWFNCGYATPANQGNISVDPQFVNAADGDFHLSPNSPLIDAGTKLQTVTTGFDGISRLEGGMHDIGAFEKKNDSNPNAITASAGSDISICDGESTTLTASGGTTYLWSNGETTASITVSPTETTTYTVTAFRWN